MPGALPAHRPAVPRGRRIGKEQLVAFDYKKEYKDIYAPSQQPSLIALDPISYVAVRGQGNPNQEDGAYQQAMELLYGVSFSIKMAPKTGCEIDGYFAYVVPPLEGFWQLDGDAAFDPQRKDEFRWISCIRLPEFVTPAVFEWACAEVARKKKRDVSAVELLTVDEGLCVQCMHVGPYDSEPATIERLQQFAEAQGYAVDCNAQRLHHEIYLSDPRRTAPDRLKTVVRLPVA